MKKHSLLKYPITVNFNNQYEYKVEIPFATVVDSYMDKDKLHFNITINKKAIKDIKKLLNCLKRMASND